MKTEHEIELRVRYCECDPGGIVHHAAYFVYFELARTEFLRAVGGDYRKMEETGQFVVVVKAECRYHRPARYDDVLRVRVALGRVRAASLEHDYQVFRGDELLATAHVVLAVVDRNGKVQMVPAELGGRDA